MKVTAKQYATTLYDLVEEKTEKQISDILVNFFSLLKRNNDVSKSDAVLTEFNNVWNEKNGVIEASITTSRKLDSATRKSVIEYIKKASEVSEVILGENVDKDLLGGVIVKYGDKIVDSSLRGRVESLGRALKK